MENGGWGGDRRTKKRMSEKVFRFNLLSWRFLFVLCHCYDLMSFFLALPVLLLTFLLLSFEVIRICLIEFLFVVLNCFSCYCWYTFIWEDASIVQWRWGTQRRKFRRLARGERDLVKFRHLHSIVGRFHRHPKQQISCHETISFSQNTLNFRFNRIFRDC